MPAENDPFRYIPESGAGSDDVTESTDPPDRSETESEVDEGVGELATEETVEIPQASDMDDSVDSQNEKNEKVSYFYNGFWHSTESTHPVEVLGPPFEGDDGKQYVEVKWFNNDGKETGKAYASVDDVVKGKQVVRIKRTSGEIEDGWFVDEIFVETESARVRKNSPDGESIVKDISWEDLWSWQQPEDKPGGAEPDSAVGADPSDGRETTTPEGPTEAGAGGGGEGPPSPPEAPPDGVEQPEDPDHEIVTPPENLTAETIALAHQYNIPVEAVRQVMGWDPPSDIDYLIRAQRSDTHRQHLKDVHRIEIPRYYPPIEPSRTDEEGEHGQAEVAHRAEIARQISRAPSALRRSLPKPRNWLEQRLLAIRIAETDAWATERLPQPTDRGLLGWIPMKKYRSNLKRVKNQNEAIKTARRALTLRRRHSVMAGSAITPRDNLAVEISEIERLERAFGFDHLNPYLPQNPPRPKPK